MKPIDDLILCDKIKREIAHLERLEARLLNLRARVLDGSASNSYSKSHRTAYVYLAWAAQNIARATDELGRITEKLLEEAPETEEIAELKEALKILEEMPKDPAISYGISKLKRAIERLEYDGEDDAHK